MYGCRLWDSIRQTDLEDWERLRQGAGDPFMDPRFVEAVERSMGPEARFWTLIVDDERGRPAASACVSLLRVDAALLADARTRSVVHVVRRLFPGFLNFRLLCVGLPVSASQSHLRIREDVDVEEALRAIDSVLLDLARRHGAALIVLKEFDPRETDRLAGLDRLGYLRADSLPTHRLDGGFGSFDGLVAALRSKYRRNIRGSQHKFERSGLRVTHVTGREGADLRFTDEVHRLYLAVLEHADHVLERLPAEFFREFCRRLGEQAVLTLVEADDRVVAWCLSLLSESSYSLLVMGMDYEAKAAGDVYFNVIFHALDYGMRQGAKEIWIGPNSEGFKSRLGCRQESRCVYVKGRGLLGRLLPAVSGRLLPAVKLSLGNRALRGTAAGGHGAACGEEAP